MGQVLLSRFGEIFVFSSDGTCLVLQDVTNANKCDFCLKISVFQSCIELLIKLHYRCEDEGFNMGVINYVVYT